MKLCLSLTLASALWLMTSFGLPASAQTPPVVATVPSTSNPSVPAGLKVVCLVGSDVLTHSQTCPVLKHNGFTYWAYSYIDNRVAMAIVSYNAAGQLMKQWEKPGARYVWQITVDAAKHTVAFHGQANASVSMAWTELLPRH